MASQYAAGNAEVYEQLMGRWSRRLATLFLDFARIGSPGAVLDVGCGTGSLAFALAAAYPAARVAGIDVSPAFIAHCRRRAADPRLEFEVADATALPLGERRYDAVLSLLVLNFVGAYETAAREMVRVARPGAVVAASVWDFAGGLPSMRMVLDTAAALDPGGEAVRAKVLGAPLVRTGELAALWTDLGLNAVEEASLTVRFDFECFEDYWRPYASGQGSIGPYIAGLDREQSARLERGVRAAYLAGRADGPRSFAATAWAVRGVR